MYDSASKLDTNKAKIAQAQLCKYLAYKGGLGDKLLHEVSSMVIKDSLVSPENIKLSLAGREIVVSPSTGTIWKIHGHALTQLSEVFKYPKVYYSRLLQGVLNIPVEECRAKLVEDLNWHTSKAQLKDRRGKPAKYLCRCVDGELRGFLSRVFKRHLASAPLLRAFISACAASGLVPVDAQNSSVFVSVQCVVPYVFEVFDGEFVTFGISWSNSDFGGGRMKVSTFVRRVYGSSFILGSAISEVHIGSVIEESDIEMSSETARAELEAQKRAVTDAVMMQMHSSHIDKVLNAIRMAQEEEIPWHRINSELGRLLHKNELEEIRNILVGTAPSAAWQGYEELPPIAFDEDGDKVATRYWTATIVGHYAEIECDASRKLELLGLAGEVLGNVKKTRGK